jgi:hypothetical protein
MTKIQNPKCEYDLKKERFFPLNAANVTIGDKTMTTQKHSDK